MPLRQAYPASDYAPEPIADFSREEDRERLSPGALRAFLNIMRVWNVRDEDMHLLLAAPESGPLDQDQLTRISYLFGIYKALHILHRDELADRWVHLPNTNRIFGGETPLAYMIREGLPGMETVRRLLDARRGGL